MRPSMLPETSRQMTRSIGLPSAFTSAAFGLSAGLGSSARSGRATPTTSATAAATAAKRKKRAMWTSSRAGKCGCGHHDISDAIVTNLDWRRCNGSVTAADVEEMTGTTKSKAWWVDGSCSLTRFGKPIRPFHAADAQLKPGVPLLPTEFLRNEVFGVLVPAADGILVGPVGHRDAEPICSTNALDSEEPRHGASQSNHVIRHRVVPLRVVGSANRREDHSEVGRWRGLCWHEHAGSLLVELIHRLSGEERSSNREG